jgi:hypothetical protein
VPDDDDRMLERLARALCPPPAIPSRAEVVALHRAVRRRWSSGTVSLRKGRVPAPSPDTGVVAMPPMIVRRVASSVAGMAARVPRRPERPGLRL